MDDYFSYTIFNSFTGQKIPSRGMGSRSRQCVGVEDVIEYRYLLPDGLCPSDIFQVTSVSPVAAIGSPSVLLNDRGVLQH